MAIKRHDQYHNGHSMSAVQFGLQLGASPAKRIDVAVVGTAGPARWESVLKTVASRFLEQVSIGVR